MPSFSNPGIVSGASLVLVNYIGTGAEGTDVTMTIPNAMANATYAVLVASAGGTSGDGTQASAVEVVDMPIASRTTTTFRVVLGKSLTAGDKLQFVVAGTLA